MLTAEESVGGGEAFVNGFNVATQVQNCWQSLGFCPQHDALWPELTTRQHLELYAAVKSSPPGTATRMLQLLDLVDHAEKMSSDLSGGNRRKLSAAIALVAQPKVSFLDEPSSG
jgi:ABC-type multidrug transport system ATPase subunit